MNFRILFPVLLAVASLLATGAASVEARPLRRARCGALPCRPVVQARICRPGTEARPCTTVCRADARSLWNLGKQMGSWPSLP